MKNKAWIHYHIVTATPKDINGKQSVVQQTYLRMLLSSIISSFKLKTLSKPARKTLPSSRLPLRQKTATKSTPPHL